MDSGKINNNFLLKLSRQIGWTSNLKQKPSPGFSERLTSKLKITILIEHDFNAPKKTMGGFLIVQRSEINFKEKSII